MKLVCLAVMLLCALATALLIRHHLTHRPVKPPIRILDPLAEPEKEIALGKELMRASDFAGAEKRFQAALDALERLRRENPGADYSWLDERITSTNVLLREARERKLTGNPLPAP